MSEFTKEELFETRVTETAAMLRAIYMHQFGLRYDPFLSKGKPIQNLMAASENAAKIVVANDLDPVMWVSAIHAEFDPKNTNRLNPVLINHSDAFNLYQKYVKTHPKEANKLTTEEWLKMLRLNEDGCAWLLAHSGFSLEYILMEEASMLDPWYRIVAPVEHSRIVIDIIDKYGPAARIYICDLRDRTLIKVLQKNGYADRVVRLTNLLSA